MTKKIIIPLSDDELRDLRIEAAKKGLSLPKLARERLFACQNCLGNASNDVSRAQTPRLTVAPMSGQGGGA